MILYIKGINVKIAEWGLTIIQNQLLMNDTSF